MRKRFEKAFDRVLLNEKERNRILENVVGQKQAVKERGRFWQGKTGGAVVVAAALLVFAAVNVLLLGGMERKSPAGMVSEETTGEEVSSFTGDNFEEASGGENDVMEEINEERTEETTVVDVDLSEEQQAQMFMALQDYMPVKNASVTAFFGEGASQGHMGIDMTSEDSVVYLVMDGTVTTYGFTAEKGNYLVIDHGNGVVTEYCCLQESKVSAGDVLGAGTPIAVYGQTGMATGPHLHWEILVNGENRNPLVYVEEHLEQFTAQPWN